MMLANGILLLIRYVKVNFKMYYLFRKPPVAFERPTGVMDKSLNFNRHRFCHTFNMKVSLKKPHKHNRHAVYHIDFSNGIRE